MTDMPACPQHHAVCHLGFRCSFAVVTLYALQKLPAFGVCGMGARLYKGPRTCLAGNTQAGQDRPHLVGLQLYLQGFLRA